MAEKIEEWNLKKKKEKENIRKYLKIIKIFPNKVKIRNANIVSSNNIEITLSNFYQYHLFYRFLYIR